MKSQCNHEENIRQTHNEGTSTKYLTSTPQVSQDYER